MPNVSDVGDVSVDGWTTLRWTIDRYTQKPNRVDTLLRSPRFTFRCGRCQLWVHPNGLKWKKTEGWTGILSRLPSLPPASTVTCCVVDSEGREILHTETERNGDWYEQFKWIPRRELEARSKEILPGGTLRVVVRVLLPGERGHRAEEEEQESGSKVSVTSSQESSDIESHTQNNEGAESGATGFSESSVSDCTRRHIDKGLNKHIQDLKDMYVESKNSDLIIRVKGREFHVHRFILQARIPAFHAMLSHDTAENKEGVVKMEDCDPDVFHEFLLFVYSGTLENLSPDNMCGLYVLGDKYGLEELKEMCLDFMRTSLSVQMICDVICLAITHREAELLKLATDFFVQNSAEIMLTVKWQVFLAENPVEGNELFLKTVTFLTTKINSK